MSIVKSMALVVLLFTAVIVETTLNKESPEQIEQRIEQERKEAHKIEELKTKMLNAR